jgi:hypothetical protein
MNVLLLPNEALLMIFKYLDNEDIETLNHFDDFRNIIKSFYFQNFVANYIITDRNIFIERYLNYNHGLFSVINNNTSINGYYHMNTKVGKWYTYTTTTSKFTANHYNQHGHKHGLQKVVEYNKNYNFFIKAYMHYLYDLPIGMYKAVQSFSNEERTLIIGSFKKGKKHGIWRYYDIIYNSSIINPLMCQGYYLNDKKNGLWIFYTGNDDDEILKISGSYINDVPSELWTFHYLTEEGTIQNAKIKYESVEKILYSNEYMTNLLNGDYI